MVRHTGKESLHYCTYKKNEAEEGLLLLVEMESISLLLLQIEVLELLLVGCVVWGVCQIVN